MNNREPELTLAFLERQPAAAARVLEEIDPGDAAAFIEAVAARYAAPVVARMAPWAAARCLSEMPAAHAASLLRAMPYQDGTSLLRLIDAQHLAPVLDQLPKGLAKDFRNSLSYPKSTVGAWMDQTVPTFPKDSPASEGLNFVKRRGSDPVSHVFVVAEKGEFVGIASVADLLRSAPKTPLAQIMQGDLKPLSNRTLLASAAAREDWDSYPMLPVVGRRKNVLGGITRANLRKGLQGHGLTRTSFAPNSLISHLLTSYVVTCSGFLRLVTEPGALIPQSSNLEKSRGRKHR